MSEQVRSEREKKTGSTKATPEKKISDKKCEYKIVFKWKKKRCIIQEKKDRKMYLGRVHGDDYSDIARNMYMHVYINIKCACKQLPCNQ